MRAKQKKAIRDKDKSQEYIEAMRKHRPMSQEPHYDDCGSDCEMLEDNEARAVAGRTDPAHASFFHAYVGDSIGEDWASYLVTRGLHCIVNLDQMLKKTKCVGGASQREDHMWNGEGWKRFSPDHNMPGWT